MQVSQARFNNVTMSINDGCQTLSCRENLFNFFTMTRSLGAGHGVSGQATFDFQQSLLSELIALNQSCATDLKIAAATRQKRGLGLERGACFTSGFGGLHFIMLFFFKRGNEFFKFTDTRFESFLTFTYLTQSRQQTLRLSSGFSTFTLHTSESF